MAPDARKPIEYMFPACKLVEGEYRDGVDSRTSKTIVIYFVLADDEFRDSATKYDAGSLKTAFATKTGRESVFVSWTLSFTGACPES